MIEITDLRKSFNGQVVLNGLSLKIAKGELVAVIGQSGVGKSVLLKHMIGLIRPDAGRIVIEGADITDFDRREIDEIRKKFGVVFQEGALFNLFTRHGKPFPFDMVVYDEISRLKTSTAKRTRAMTKTNKMRTSNDFFKAFSRGCHYTTSLGQIETS